MNIVPEELIQSFNFAELQRLGKTEEYLKDDERLYRELSQLKPNGWYRHHRLVKRFWSFVTTIGECWVWNGLLRSGYGSFGGIAAHRWLWKYILKRDAPAGMHLHHKCRNKRCIADLKSL
jgi:hypothetical protein